MAGYGWDEFDLDPVYSSKVKITISSVYSTGENGFIEAEIYAGTISVSLVLT